MLHIVPLDDPPGHQPSTECSCGPDVEWVDAETGLPHAHALVTHHSHDGREKMEVAGTPNGKGWIIAKS